MGTQGLKRGPLENEYARASATLRLMRTMLLYLLQHTDAMDTADGIRQWWLPLHWECTREEVQAALEVLVARSWVITRGSADESRLYGLNKQSLTQVMQFIAVGRENSLDKIH